MAPSDRKKQRRQSMTFPDLAKINNVMSEVELHEYYMNKNYVEPQKIQLETIFESGGRRGVSENGELIPGKNKAKRYIENYSFWKQNDKDKNRRRKSMIQKQFKGRKRIKAKPSSVEQEQNLIELIQNVPEIESFEESRYEQSELGELLEKAYELILLRCRRSYLEANAAQASQQGTTESQFPPLEDNNSNYHPHNQSRAMEDSIVPEHHIPGARSYTHSTYSVPEPDVTKCSNDLYNADNQNQSCVTNDDVFNSQDEESCTTRTSYSRSEHSQQCSVSDQSVSSKYESLEEFDPALILQSMKDDAMKEEFLKALEDTDLMFCEDPFPKPRARAVPKKADRASMRRSVRRSARFMNHGPNLAGSVDIEVDVKLKKARAKKDKKEAIVVDEDFTEGIVVDEDSKEGTVVDEDSKEGTVVDEASKEGTVVGEDSKEGTGVDEDTANAESSKKETAESSKDEPCIVQAENVKKKRRFVAEIDLNDSNKENNSPPVKPRKNFKRKPTFRFEMSSSSDDDDNALLKPDPTALAEETSHKVNTSVSDNRSSMDIALPECVRRSLTGEFVPLPQIEKELEKLELSVRNKSKKNKRKSVTRKPLEALSIPEIHIQQAESSLSKEENLREKDCSNINNLQPPLKEFGKDSLSGSDEEVWLTGILKFPKKNKTNDELNKRIYPSISSVDSDFG